MSQYSATPVPNPTWRGMYRDSTNSMQLTEVGCGEMIIQNNPRDHHLNVDDVSSSSATN
jgi:hypothetical protein